MGLLTRSGLLIPLGLVVLGIGLAYNIPGLSASEGPTEPTLEYNRFADSVVLDLSYSGGRIANPDPIPFIRVFGDGKVVLHYPAYMKKAGDYTLQLSTEELEKLLQYFATEELLTAPDSVQAMATSAMAQSGPSELPGDHGVKTNVKVNFDRVVPADPTRDPLTDVETTISIQSSAIAAVTNTEIQPLQSFSRGIKELENLANNPDLVKLLDGN